jgi:ubiquinone/menaquinone biosynthesis C-methylase UbiE
MTPNEYKKMARAEANHWFYLGKRQIAKWAVSRFGGRVVHPTLLDCGAGTGKFAEEMMSSHQVTVLDDHAESLVYLRDRFSHDQVVEGSATRIPLPDQSFDCVTMLDVLEHVDDDHAAITELHRVLKPGGVLVITVPAMMVLWSNWDEVLHHHRRYERESLARLFDSSLWERRYLKYVNTAAFPLVWWIRRRRKSGDSTASEEFLPPSWLNTVLRWMFVFPARKAWFPAPFGVGLIVVLRKR